MTEETNNQPFCTPSIIGECPHCGEPYVEYCGGMSCLSCGLIESFRMIAIRVVTGKDTSFRAIKEKNHG